MEHNGDGLRDEIAPMIYGMDVDKERKHAEVVSSSRRRRPTRCVRPPRRANSKGSSSPSSI